MTVVDGVLLGANDVRLVAEWLRSAHVAKLKRLKLIDPVGLGQAELGRLPLALAATAAPLKHMALSFSNHSPPLIQLSCLTQLTSFELKGGSLGEAVANQLPAMSGLQHLSLSGCMIDDRSVIEAVLGWVASLPQLTRLELWGDGRESGSAVTASVLQVLGSQVVEHAENVFIYPATGGVMDAM